jgi:hypothetical protein
VVEQPYAPMAVKFPLDITFAFQGIQPIYHNLMGFDITGLLYLAQIRRAFMQADVAFKKEVYLLLVGGKIVGHLEAADLG